MRKEKNIVEEYYIIDYPYLIEYMKTCNKS
jgi:hypothetical protein